MFPNVNNAPDPIFLWVLLMLSGGQRFTARELAEVPGRPTGKDLGHEYASSCLDRDA